MHSENKMEPILQIPTDRLIIYSLSVTLVALAGGLPPMFGKWNQRQLHLFVAFGGGTILGAIFFHLLPDSILAGSEDLSSAMVLLGFISILMVERILIQTRVHDINHNALRRHQFVGITAMIGLSAHSLIGGFGLAVGMLEPELGFAIFLAIIMHKATEAFSLTTIFRLAEFPSRKTLGLLLIYSLMTPLGALMSIPFVRSLANINLAIPAGLTAGTFLYVATLDLIPEVFHGEGGKALPFAILLFGIVIMYFVKVLGG
jgi:zinc transporter ZupT